MSNSTLKASFVTALFAGFGLVGLAPFFDHFVPTLWYSAAMYALLLAHTFFSIRCFSHVVNPKDPTQILMDIVLVVCFLNLGFRLGSQSLGLPLAWTLLFVFASLKYALLVGWIPHPHLLRRKLVADIGGIFMGVVFYELVFYASITNIIPYELPYQIFTFFFLLASGYYFFIRPLYVPDRSV